MTDEILDLIIGDPTTDITDVEVKQNTGPIGGGDGGIIAAIVGFLGIGYLAFFTDFFSAIIDFITGLF